MTTLDGVERALDARRPAHLRRRARSAGHRRDHGWRDRRRSSDDHDRDPARVGVLRADGHRPHLEAAEAPLRVERPLRAGHRPRRRRRARGPGDGAARRGRRARASRPTRSTSTRAPVERRPDRACARRKVNGVLGTALTDAEVLDALAPLGIEVSGCGRRRSSRVAPTLPARPRTRDRPGRGGRAPGRLRRHRPHGRPPDRARSARSRTRSRTAGSSPTRCVGAGLSEAITLPLVAPDDLARAGAPDRPRRRGGEPAAGRGVGAADAHPARAAARRRLQPRAAASPTSRCSRSAGSSSRPTAAALLPDEPYHLAVAMAGVVRRRRRSRTTAPVDVYDAVDVLRAVAGALEVHDWRLEAGDATRVPPVAAPRLVLVGGAEVGLVGEVDAACRRRPRARARRRRVRARPRRPARRRPARPGVPGPVAVPAVEHRPRVRRRRRRGRGRRGRDAAHRRRRPRRGRPLFDVFRAEALGAGRKSLAFSLRFRAAGPDAHRRRGRRAPRHGHRGRHRRTRRGPARLTPRCTGAGRADRRRARLAACGPANGERTDFYAVLGVAPSAPSDEIAAAYRARAKELHPDAAPVDEVAAERFKNVSVAYRGPVGARHPARVRPVPRVLPAGRRPRDRCRGRRPRRPGPRPARRPGVTTVVDRPGRRPLPAHAAGRPLGRDLGDRLHPRRDRVRLARPRRSSTTTRSLRDRGRDASAVVVSTPGGARLQFTTSDGRVVNAALPQKSGSGDPVVGEQLKIRYDPNDPTDVITDADTTARDITLWIVSGEAAHLRPDPRWSSGRSDCAGLRAPTGRVRRPVRAHRPATVRGGRRPGRRLQRALAHLLRRVVHALLRVARLRAVGRVLPRVRRHAREGRRRVAGPRRLRRPRRRSRSSRPGSATRPSTSGTRPGSTATSSAPRPSPTSASSPGPHESVSIPDALRAKLEAAGAN